MLFQEYANSTLNKNEITKYRDLLQEEIDKLILNEWNFLNDNWKKVFK